MTAAAMFYLGRMIYDARIGALAAIIYITLPVSRFPAC